MGLLDFFGFGKRKKMVKEALQNNALIVDVRTAVEYQGASLSESQNIPLDRLSTQLNRLYAHGKPVVFCCASGMRSGMATRMARAKGLEAYNGGSWIQVKDWLQQY